MATRALRPHKAVKGGHTATHFPQSLQAALELAPILPDRIVKEHTAGQGASSKTARALPPPSRPEKKSPGPKKSELRGREGLGTVWCNADGAGYGRRPSQNRGKMAELAVFNPLALLTAVNLCTTVSLIPLETSGKQRGYTGFATAHFASRIPRSGHKQSGCG